MIRAEDAEYALFRPDLGVHEDIVTDMSGNAQLTMYVLVQDHARDLHCRMR